MSLTNALRRAVWLIEFLLEHEEVQLKEIDAAWLQSGLSESKAISRFTWTKVFDSISELFGINIECTGRGSHNAKYFLANRRQVKSQALLRWMLRCLHIKLQILDSSVIHDRILLEDFPSENGNFIPIKNAMCKNTKLEFEYCRYGYEKKHRKIQPYAIKTYKYRYYVLGRFDSGRFCIFSFDRMKNLVVTDEHFDMDNLFEAERFFEKFFGVYIDETKPVEKVIVRAYEDAPNYLFDVPLHCSQKMIYRCKQYTDFRFTVVPTNDFIGALLQQGDRLEVMSPEWLRNEVANRIEKMLARYKVS